MLAGWEWYTSFLPCLLLTSHLISSVSSLAASAPQGKNHHLFVWHPKSVSSLSTALGPLVEWGFACIYLSSEHVPPLALRKGGWVWRKDQIYPSNLSQSVVLSLVLELASAHRVDRGWGVDFHSLVCQEHTKRAGMLEDLFSELLQVSCKGKRFTFCYNLYLQGFLRRAHSVSAPVSCSCCPWAATRFSLKFVMV